MHIVADLQFMFVSPYYGLKEAVTNILRGIHKHPSVSRLTVISDTQEFVKSILPGPGTYTRVGSRAVPKFLKYNKVDVYLSPDCGSAMRRALALRALVSLDYVVAGIVHSANTIRFQDNLKSLLSLRKTDVLFVSSEACRTAVSRILHPAQKRLVVIPLGASSPIYKSGYSVESFKKEHDIAGKKMVLSLARFDKWDIQPVVDAFERDIFSRRDDVVLVLAGSSGMYRGLNDRVLEFPRDNVLVLPNVSEEFKSVLYQSASVFLAVSNCFQESYGITLEEAKSYDLPIVATDFDGYRDHLNWDQLVPTIRGDSLDYDLYMDRLGEALGDAAFEREQMLRIAIDVDTLCQKVLEALDLPKRKLTFRSWSVVVEDYVTVLSSMIRSTSNRVTLKSKYGLWTNFKHYASDTLDSFKLYPVTDRGAKLLEHYEEIKTVDTINDVLEAITAGQIKVRKEGMKWI